MGESEGKPNPKTKGTFKPSPLKGGRSRTVRRLLQKLSGVRLTEFLEWGENIPSKHSEGQRSDPYKKKHKARRKLRGKIAYASRKMNRSRK